MKIYTCLAMVASTFALCTGCNDVDWPDPEYIVSLRILGVHAEPPTLAPGQSTRVSLYCADGSRGPKDDPRCNVEVAWFGRCDNPPKNDPKKCFDQYSDWPDRLAPAVADTPIDRWPDGFGVGSFFDFTAPEAVLSEEATVRGSAVRYGTSYVFFAACAGQLVTVKNASDRLPVECHDRNSGRLLDQRDFIVGYTTLYSYDRIKSANPEPKNARFDGVQFPASCSGELACPSGFECSSDAQCLPVVSPCTRSGRCQAHCLDFEFERASFELTTLDGTPIAAPRKSVWIKYFTNAGRLPSDPNIDVPFPADSATRTDRRCIEWQAPTFPTEQAHVWVAVRDDRGGLTVWDQRILVR